MKLHKSLTMRGELIIKRGINLVLQRIDQIVLLYLFDKFNKWIGP